MFNTKLFQIKMIEAGLNREELAIKSKVSVSTIGRILNNETCSIESANRLAKALNLTFEEAGFIFFSKLVS